MKLQEQLEQKQEDLEFSIRSLRTLTAHKDSLADEVKSLKQQITEEKKPKLRHGRCGITSLGEPYITIGNGVDAVIYLEDGERDPVGRKQNGKSRDTATILFEAFDDLTALSKPLTEFEMYSQKSKRNLSISGPNADGDVYVEIQEREISTRTLGILRVPLDEFILNLRRLQATLKK